jgi:hypothetical protein
MHFISLNILSDFMQDLSIKRKYYTKDDQFSSRTLFSIISLLQEQELNHSNYFEQELNARNFIQAKEHDMNMHAKIQCMNMHGFL